MQIRTVNLKEDASAYLEDITKLLFENLVINLPDEGWALRDASSQVENLLLNLEKGTAQLFIATEEDRLIGFAWTYERKFARRSRLHINHIIVQSDRRGGRIGQKILDAIIAKAKEMNVDAIDLFSSKDREDVVHFYIQNGFCVERLQMIYRLPKT